MEQEKVIVYCGGKFYFDGEDSNYSHYAKNDYRAKFLGDVNKLLYPQESYKVTENVDYIGPFYFECDDMNAPTIVAMESEMLQRCTDAVFILDQVDAPGTVAEMIYAATLQKRVHIYYVQGVDAAIDSHTPNWFPILMSCQINVNTSITSCASREEAEQKATEFILSL